MKYIKPSLLRTMRENILTISGETLPRVQMRVFDLDEEGDFSTFVMGDLKIRYSGKFLSAAFGKRTSDGVELRQGIVIGADGDGLGRAYAAHCHTLFISHHNGLNQGCRRGFCPEQDLSPLSAGRHHHR